MTDDIHSLSGAYAVDALTDAERAAFEEHLEHCAACRDEVDSLREAAADLSLLSAEEPPASLRHDVLRRVSTVRPEPPRLADRRARRRTRTWLAGVAAAAVVAAGVGVGVTQPWQDTSQAPQLTVAERIERADDAQRISVSFDDGSVATVLRSESLNRAVIETSDMAPPPEGQHYVVWLQEPDGQMHHAGAMPADASDASMPLKGDAAAAIGAGITIESDPQTPEPTSEPVALFSFT
ncbi:anti-sigma factor domain-containing protein [Aeromicrobium phragmitis]|nr:anti-sigma factor [Aeromicrobium phragmitis]